VITAGALDAHGCARVGGSETANEPANLPDMHVDRARRRMAQADEAMLRLCRLVHLLKNGLAYRQKGRMCAIYGLRFSQSLADTFAVLHR
jgi:hypothetical protein